jgi:cytochrome c oxidase cbb3-type subunit 3
MRELEQSQMKTLNRMTKSLSNGCLLRRSVRMGAFLMCALAMYGQSAIPRNQKHSGGKPASGQRAFDTSCASCHGLNGRGGERAPSIATQSGIVKLSDDQLLKILQDGKPQAGMPPFAGLGDKRLALILSYLRLLQGKQDTPITLADAANGKNLFEGKGGCAECHMILGVGGFLGPDLSNYGATHSTNDIRNAIVSADARPGARKGLARATTSDGRQISGFVRNEDNFSVQLQAPDGTFHMLEKSGLLQLTLYSAPLMPGDYGTKLSKSELNQLVAYLLSVGGKK